MSWKTCYTPPDPKHWQGRADSPDSANFFQITQMLNLQNGVPLNSQQFTVALIGFRCDEGIRRNLGRPGAAEGPISAREALAKLSVPKREFTCYDVGDINCIDGDLEGAQAALAEVIELLLQHEITPIVIGGGHEVAWGNFQGIAKQYPKENLGIVNFDAHFDMRPLLPQNKGSSGTSFLQIADALQEAGRRFDYNCIGIQPAVNIRKLFETAKSHETKILYAYDLYQNNIEQTMSFVNRIIYNNKIIYMSLCMDVFATPYAPGVSAPQPMGLTPWQIVPIVRQLARSGKVVSYDIAELSPPFDTDQRTAKLAANFIYDIIQFHNRERTA